MGSPLEPRHNPDDVHGHGRDHMVQMRFGLPPIAGLAKFKGPNPLGKCSFNSSPSIIAPFPFRGLLALARLLQHRVFRLGTHRDRA